MRRRALDAQQGLLDLRREDVDAADDQHVVGAAGDAAHARRGTAAGAGLAPEPGDVAGAVAEHRHRLAGQRGDHQLARLAVGHRLERLGVQALDEEVVLLQVHPAARGAFAADAGPDHLRQAVVVEGEDVELVLDLAAHVLGPGLAAEVPEAERERARVDAELAGRVGDGQRVTRGADQDLRVEVADDVDLPPGVAGCCRDDRRADALDAVVQPEPAREKAVAEGDLAGVLGPQPAGDQEARAEIGPGPHVLRRVGDKGRLAGRPRRAVDAREILARDGEEAERVVAAQVVLGGEGQASDVVGRPDAAPRDVVQREVVAIDGHARGAVDELAQALDLQRRAARRGTASRARPRRGSRTGMTPSSIGQGTCWNSSSGPTTCSPALTSWSMAVSGSSKRKMRIALSPRRSEKAYMYSMLRPAPSSALSALASPPGRSRTSTATTSVMLATQPASSSSRFAFSHSRTIRRRMPNWAVSASDRVIRLMPAAPRISSGAPRRPGLFSRKSESCCSFMVCPPGGVSDVAAVDDALGLALAALDGARLDQAQVDAYAEDVLDGVRQAGAHVLEGADLVAEDLGGHLDLDGHLVEAVVAREDDLVVRQGPLDREQRRLDLRRVHVDAADDEHVIGAPAYAPDAADRPPAAAALRQDLGDVARAVADHRHRLLRERGEHQLALAAVGQRLAALGVDDLGVEVVLEHVQAVVGAALARYAGADDLGQAVDVEGLDARVRSGCARASRPTRARRRTRRRAAAGPSCPRPARRRAR